MNKNNIFEYAKDNQVPLIAEKPWVIYVVDDDEGVLKTTRDALEYYTYKERNVELFFYTNASDVIKVLKDDNPLNPDVAVILLDIVMEDSGFEVIKYLRNQKENNITQIIMRTGQAGKTIQEEHEIAQEYEINDFIDKSENSYKRIRTAVTTSLRMVQLLKDVIGFQRNIDIMNSSLMEYFNLKKEKTILTKEDSETVIISIFNHLNENYYSNKKILSHACLDKLVELRISNLQVLFVMLYNTLKQSKNENVLPDDLSPGKCESKLKWEKDESWLKKLYSALCGNIIGDMKRSEKFIAPDTPWPIFRDHHMGLVPVAPIQWLGNLNDLLYLYYAFHRDHYIAFGIWDIIHKELEAHYCNKSGMLNFYTLKTYKARYKFTKNQTTPDGKTIKTEEWIWDTPNKELIDEIIYNLED